MEVDNTDVTEFIVAHVSGEVEVMADMTESFAGGVTLETFRPSGEQVDVVTGIRD